MIQVNIVIDYDIVGTALASHYTPVLSGQAIITPNSSYVDIAIQPLDNNLLDGSRTVGITLTGTSHPQVNVDATPATITILDDEQATASITASPITISENGEIGTFTISLDAPNNTGADITIDYTVGGTAVDGTDYAPTTPVTGTVVIADGQDSAEIEITSIDNQVLDGSRTVEITLTETDHTQVAVDTTPATITITDDEQATASITASPITISENGEIGTFTISLDEPNNTGADITIDYTVGGTAVDGTDYAPTTPITGTVVIADGQDSAEIEITSIDNQVLDGSRTVEITLTETDHTQVAVDTTPATITILDDESSYASIAASPLTITENPEETGTFTITLSHVNNTSAPITVTYTVGGTADSTHYTLTGDAIIPTNGQTAEITLTPIDNQVLDGSRTVEITLTETDHTQVAVDTTPATITILDDESSYASIAASPLTITENPEETGTFTISLDEPNATGADITIDYTVGGTAVDGTDYAPTIAFTGNVVIADGQDSAEIEITSIDNDLIDFSRTVEITLTGADHPAINIDPTPAIITILDDEVAPTPLVTDVIDANGVKIEGITYRLSIDEMTIKFNQAVFDDGTGSHADSASNPANYILIKKGGNSGEHTASCVAGVSPNDETINFASVSYNPSTFITNIRFTSALPDGEYRLLICATTSIVSAIDPSIHLNNGVDVVVNFRVDSTASAEELLPLPTPAQPEDLGVVELPATGERPLWAELIERWLGR
jgi:hypothetical protein